MIQIDVDFEVWKKLTALRENETHTYNDVLRTLLHVEPSAASAAGEAEPTATDDGGCVLGGRVLPNGTRLRARYKGNLYQAHISEGTLVGADGKHFPSASAAASAITNTNVNGLSFWEARRPSDTEWRKLLLFPRQK